MGEMSYAEKVMAFIHCRWEMLKVEELSWTGPESIRVTFDDDPEVYALDDVACTGAKTLVTAIGDRLRILPAIIGDLILFTSNGGEDEDECEPSRDPFGTSEDAQTFEDNDFFDPDESEEIETEVHRLIGELQSAGMCSHEITVKIRIHRDGEMFGRTRHQGDAVVEIRDIMKDGGEDPHPVFISTSLGMP